MQRTITFRVDWSRQLGLGHLQRCLSLAEALSMRGIRCVLVAKRQPTTVAPRDVQISWLRATEQAATTYDANSGCRVSEMPDLSKEEDARLSIEAISKVRAEAVVVDSYGLDWVWESLVREELGVPIVAIDGLADRRHTADIVVDPTYVKDDRDRWLGRVGADTQVLRGPRYALISPRFEGQLVKRPSRDGRVERVLVSFGGSDPQNLTDRALDAFELLTDLNLALDVVVGAGHSTPQAVQARCANLPNATFHHATTRMADLMTAADLAVGSGGITTYERALLGLPAIVIVAAANQVTQVASVAQANALLALGTAENVTSEQLAFAVRSLAADEDAVRRMSAAARAIVEHDTVPGSHRVAEEAVKLLS